MCPDNGYFLFDSGLLEPGEKNGSTICANNCDRAFVDQANAAYKAASKSKQKLMDNASGANRTSESSCRNALKKLYPDDKNNKPVDCVQEGDTTHFANSKEYCIVDESVFRVNLFFKDLAPKRTGTEYYMCAKNSLNDCKGDEWVTVSNPENGVYTVCGDRNKGLKGKIHGDEDECKDDGSDWFWPETTYRMYLALGKTDLKDKDTLQNNVVRIASFYVGHFYPDITAPTSTLIVGPIPPGQWDDLYVDNTRKTAEITLTMQGRNEKGRNDADRYNDYFVKVFSTESDYRTTTSQCIFIKGPSTTPQTIKVALPQTWIPDDPHILPVDLSPGSYVLRIKDGTDGNFDANNPSCHEGDFTYYDIPFRIGQGHTTCKDASGKSSSCIDRGDFGSPIKDPFGREKYKPVKMITPEPICKPDPDTGLCSSIPTALGFSIHTKPNEFISDLFSIALSLGGIASFAFFIRAGYTILTSAGNKEKIGQAREQITAAITGLIFLILSITILEFIGINVLHIPGFGR